MHEFLGGSNLPKNVAREREKEEKIRTQPFHHKHDQMRKKEQIKIGRVHYL